MDKPSPDGCIIFLTLDGTRYQYSFADIRYHSEERAGYVVGLCSPKGRVLFPWHTLIQVKSVHNSSEYIKKLGEWSLEAHPLHEAEDKLDPQCTVCAPILAFRHQMEASP